MGIIPRNNQKWGQAMNVLYEMPKLSLRQLMTMIMPCVSVEERLRAKEALKKIREEEKKRRIAEKEKK